MLGIRIDLQQFVFVLNTLSVFICVHPRPIIGRLAVLSNSPIVGLSNFRHFYLCSAVYRILLRTDLILSPSTTFLSLRSSSWIVV